MSEKNGKRDTQRTETGYEIPVPKRGDVMDVFKRATRKHDKTPKKRSKRK